jgi:hypothetical protein
VHFMSWAITRCKSRVNTERERKSRKIADEVSSLLQKGKEDYVYSTDCCCHHRSSSIHHPFVAAEDIQT